MNPQLVCQCLVGNFFLSAKTLLNFHATPATLHTLVTAFISIAYRGIFYKRSTKR